MTETKFQVIERELTALEVADDGGYTLGAADKAGTIYDVVLESIAPVSGRLEVLNRGSDGVASVILATIDGSVIELTSDVEDRKVTAGDVIALADRGTSLFSGRLRVVFQQDDEPEGSSQLEGEAEEVSEVPPEEHDVQDDDEEAG